MKTLISYVVCLGICFVAWGTTLAQSQKRPDRIKATRTVSGYFQGFEVGDYTHPLIKLTTGKKVSFFLGQSESLEYFLASHKGKQLKLTYQVVDSYIPEAGGYETIKRLVSATIGDEADSAWWKREQKTGSAETLRKKYDALVERATLN